MGILALDRQSVSFGDPTLAKHRTLSRNEIPELAPFSTRHLGLNQGAYPIIVGSCLETGLSTASDKSIRGDHV